MAFDIITHGGGEALVYTFNAIAMFFNGGRASTIGILLSFCIAYACVKVAAEMVWQQSLSYPVKWIAGYIVLLTVLTSSTCTVIIRDRVTTLAHQVNNVPFLLGFPAAMISQIGDVMAKTSDQFFADKAGGGMKGRAMQYRLTGVAMSSKLIANASFLPFADREMANNMRNYIGECVYYDLAFGKYSMDELLDTEDMWKLVSQNASAHGGVILQTGRKRELLSCKEAAVKIDKAWRDNLDKTAYYFGRRMYPNDKAPAMSLKANLVTAYSYMTKQVDSADKILQQNIMRGALIDGYYAGAIRRGSNGAQLQTLALARAKSAQDAVYALHGSMAEQSVALIKIVIEVLLYGIFPIVCLIAALPGCLSVLKTYMYSLAWLQSWAPLYSILNMIINLSAKTISLSAIDLGNRSGITASTISGLGELHISAANYAGFLMMSIPFFSWGLFKVGGGVISSITNHIGGPMQRTAEQAGREQADGNVNQGNLNYDNLNARNHNRLKFDDNASYRSGRLSMQGLGGETISGAPGERPVIDMEPSMSKLGSNINSREEISSACNNLAMKSLTAANNQMKEYGDTMSDALDYANQYGSNRINSETSDDTYGHELTTGQRDALDRVNGIIDNYAKEHNVTKQAATKKMLSANVGWGSKDMKGLGKAINETFGFQAGVSGQYEKTWDDSNAKGQKASGGLDNRENFASAIDDLQRAFEGHTFRDSESGSKSSGTTISDKFNRALVARDAANASLSDAKIYQEQAQLAETKGVGWVDNLSNDIQDWWANKNDSDGNPIGHTGVVEGLKNPETRQEMFTKFFEERATALKEQHQSNTDVNRQSVFDFHEENKQTVGDEKDVLDFHVTNEESIELLAELDDLNRSVDLGNKMDGIETKIKLEERKSKRKELFDQKKLALQNDKGEFNKK